MREMVDCSIASLRWGIMELLLGMIPTFALSIGSRAHLRYALPLYLMKNDHSITSSSK